MGGKGKDKNVKKYIQTTLGTKSAAVKEDSPDFFWTEAFVKVPTDDGSPTSHAKCMVCSKQCKWTGHSDTSNLNKHISKANDEPHRAMAKRLTKHKVASGSSEKLTITPDGKIVRKFTHLQRKPHHWRFVFWAASTCRPFNIVNDRAFRTWIAGLCPG